jgi:hypothetical protein
MADGVLYFPMIRPPENAWFARVLLYWDKVGTIMPEQYSDDRGFLGPYTSALREKGLLTVVPPSESVWKSGANNYLTAFLELVDSDPFGVRRAPAAQREWVNVHVDKTGVELAGLLQERELAKGYEGDEFAVGGYLAAWVVVERRTAELLMAFLASIVGNDPDVAMDPITDSEAAMAAFTTLPEKYRELTPEIEPIRYALLEDILPGPSREIDVPKLAEFKAEYQQLLIRFRNRVERETIDCAQITDPRFRAKQAELARKTLADEVREIEQRMSQRKLGPISRGAIAIAAPAVALVDLVLTGGSLLAVTAGALGLGGATDSAYRGTRRKDILKNPLAYAAVARRDLAREATR